MDALLDKLVKPDSTKTVKTQPAVEQTEPEHQPEEIRKNVLDQLTDSPEGNSTDA